MELWIPITHWTTPPFYGTVTAPATCMLQKDNIAMRTVSARYRQALSFLLVLILLGFCSPPGAQADGGAPNLAYVSGTSSGISVIDVGQAKVAKTIPVAGDPHTILLSQDGRLLYVTHPTIGQVSIVAARTGQIICSVHLPGEPTLLAIDQATTTLYAAGTGAARVTALNSMNCAVQHVFNTESPIYGLAVTLPGSGDGSSNQLWAAGQDSLMIFDDRSGQTLGKIPLAEGPQYLSIPPDGMVYVATRQGNVDVVDFKTREVHQLLTGGTFGPMDYDALTGEVYVPDEQHNLLDVLSPVDSGTPTIPKEPNRVIRTGVPPEAVAITSDGLLGFVALQGGKVAMFDLLNRHLVYTIDVGGMPHFVITGLYPPATDPTPLANKSAVRGDKSAPTPGIVTNMLYVLAVVFFMVFLISGFLLLLRRRK